MTINGNMRAYRMATIFFCEAVLGTYILSYKEYFEHFEIVMRQDVYYRFFKELVESNSNGNARFSASIFTVDGALVYRVTFYKNSFKKFMIALFGSPHFQFLKSERLSGIVIRPTTTLEEVKKLASSIKLERESR